MTWTIDMATLLLWMRSQGMSFDFCAEVIGREMKKPIRTEVCVQKYNQLMRGTK